MLTARRAGLLLSLLALSGALAWGSPDDEADCERERATLFDEVRARRSDGPDVRRELIDRVRGVIGRYARTAPTCVGRLREHEVYLYLMDDRFEEMVSTSSAYLDGAGRATSVRSQVILRMQQAYALGRLGQTLESARASYAAASLAGDAPAVYGARALTEAGRIARMLGELDESEAYLRAALDLVEDSIDVAPGLADIKGLTLLSYSILTDLKLRDAVSDAERDSLVALLDERTAAGLAVLSTTGQPAGHRSVVLSLSAVAAAHQGDLERARRRIREAPALAREAGLLAPEALFEALMAEGRIAEIEGDMAAAADAYRRGRDEALRLGSPRNEAAALEHLGLLEERRGRWAEAAGYFEQAIERREIERDRLGLDDWSSSAFATMQRPYRGLVRTQLATGDVRGAFRTLDQTRARYLRDLLRYQTIRATLRSETRRQIDSVVERLSETRLAFLRAATPEERAAHRFETSAYQQEIAELTATAPLDSLPELDLGALQAQLATEGRVLVTYFVDDARSAAFVLTPDTLVSVPLEATRATVRAQLEAVGWPWRAGPPDPALALPPLHRLHQLLVAPVRPWIETDRVTIVPDVDIATVPFAALTAAPAEDYATAQYLLHDWVISTDLAAALVRTNGASNEETTPRPLDVIAFGKSTFTRSRSTWNTAGLSDLPNVSREVERVAMAGRADALIDADATERRFRQRAEEADVVHLASHAEVNPTLPLYSRIALSEDGRDDGVLHLYEVLDLDLDVDLVVLSGCSTAGGGRRGGEGLVGLQYGMRAAGARATVATLWPVADDATAELMGTFYDGLAAGRGKDEALRDAQRAYLAAHSGIEASPFYWAAPIHSGSPDPVPFERGMLGWALGAGFVGAVLAAWVAWRRRPYPADV